MTSTFGHPGIALFIPAFLTDWFLLSPLCHTHSLSLLTSYIVTQHLVALKFRIPWLTENYILWYLLLSSCQFNSVFRPFHRKFVWICVLAFVRWTNLFHHLQRTADYLGLHCHSWCFLSFFVCFCIASIFPLVLLTSFNFSSSLCCHSARWRDLTCHVCQNWS